MPEKELVSLATRLFTAKKHKQDCALEGPCLGQGSSKLQDGHAARGIIVGAVIDHVPMHRNANSQMIKMCGQQDCLVFEPWVAAGKNADHVAGVPRLAAFAEIEKSGDILNKTASVALGRPS